MHLNKEKLLTELEFLRRHYDRLAELMGVINTERSYEHKLQHKGKVKFIDYLVLRIKDKDFE